MIRCKPHFLFSLLSASLLTSCASQGGQSYAPASAAPRPQAQSETEIKVAKKLLATAQKYSLAENIEICGYLGVTETGEFTSTDLQRGEERSCTLPAVPATMRVLSIFHSHGAYNPFFDRELPSPDDARLALEHVEDNYIVTPAGRVWYLDARAKTARILCGEGCLEADPKYEAAYTQVSKSVYSLGELWSFGSNAFADDP